jgi:hypothetical protein
MLQHNSDRTVEKLKKVAVVLRRTVARLETAKDMQFANLQRYCCEQRERDDKEANESTRRLMVSYLFEKAAGVDLDPVLRKWQTTGGILGGERVARFMEHWRHVYVFVFEACAGDG